MEKTVSERLGALINLLGISKNNFAKSIGVAATQVYNICDGRNAPSHGMYEAIAKTYPNVNLRWLITGQGMPLFAMKDGDQTETSAKDLMTRLKLVEEQLEKIKVSKES